MSVGTRFANGSLAQFAVVLGGVIALSILAAILGAFGLADYLVAYLFVFAGLAICAVWSRHNTPDTPEGSSISVGIEWLSAFGLFGIVGAVFAYGHDGLAVLIGLAGGFVLSQLLIAPRLSIVSIRSIPDFLAMRYGSEAIRYIALGIMALVTLLFLAAQFVATGLIAVQVFNIPAISGISLGAVAVLALAIPSRRGTISSAQVLMAAVALAATSIVAICLLASKTSVFVPQLSYGGLFRDIGAAEMRLGMTSLFGPEVESLGLLNFLFFTICLTVGSAVMPHLVNRVTDHGHPGRTQFALRRGLLLFVLIATALPALALLGRSEFLSLFVAAKNALPIDALPHAVAHAAEICGAELSRASEACVAAGIVGGVPAAMVSVEPQSVVMAVPALSTTSAWQVGLLALAGLAVATVAGASAVYTFADALSSRAPSADAPGERAISIIAMTVVAILFASVTGLDVLSLGAWAYSLIGAALFAPLLLGLWWRRTTGTGAIVGMLGGMTLTAIYIIGASVGFDFSAATGDEWCWFGVSPLMAGVFGIAASFVLTCVLSMLGDEPPLAQVEIVDRLDAPAFIASPGALE